MANRERAIELATAAFCRRHGCKPDAVTVTGVEQQQIPNPPTPPGQVTTMPVRYRFFVSLRWGAVSERLRVKGANVYAG